MMAKLMHKNIISKGIVRSDRAVQIEDAASAIGAIVDEDFDKFVRRKLRHFA